MRNALFLMFFTVGCSSSLTESVSELESRADSVNDCCEIERSSLGREDHLVRLGSRVVLVHDWVKSSSGKYVGFSMTVSEGKPMSYLIKVTDGMKSSSSTSWSDPENAISSINFCGGCDNPDGCEGGGGDGGDDGGGDGGGECQGGDGCPGGTSGGDGPLL
jgi:hypothetical protein